MTTLKRNWNRSGNRRRPREGGGVPITDDAVFAASRADRERRIDESVAITRTWTLAEVFAARTGR